MHVLSKDLKEGDHSRYVSADRSMILKWILDVGVRMHSIGSKGPTEGFCEHCNEYYDSIKDRDF
jgi:hypothetical protein